MAWRNGTTVDRTPAELELAAYTTDSGVALPALPQPLVYPSGALYCRTTDFTIWRSNGGGWDQLATPPASYALGGDLTGTTAAAQIAAGAIVNADVNPSAAIAATKLALPTPYGFSNDRSGVIASGSAPGVNQIRMMRWTVEETRSYTEMTVYLTAVAAANMVAGVYDTSATNLNLLGSTNSIAIGSLNTWQAGLVFTSAVPLTIGQDVFIAVHTDNSTPAFGRTAVASNTAVSQLPAGYLRGGDASGFNWCNFNRGSYSAPLPNTISVASLTSNAGGFIFWIK